MLCGVEKSSHEKKSALHYPRVFKHGVPENPIYVVRWFFRIFPITTPFSLGIFQPAMFGYRSNNWGWFDHPPLILKESHWDFSACRITWFEPDLGHVSLLDSHDLSSPSPTVAHLGKVPGGRVSPAHSEAPFRWHTEERWLWLSQALGDEISPWSGNGNRVLADDFPIFCHSHFAKRGCAPCAVIIVANDFPMFFRSCCFPEKVVPPSDHYYCLLATPHQLEQLML